MQAQHKDVVKNVTTASQLESELQLSQAQHGVAVLDVYNAEWGSCKALGETFRRLFTDAGDVTHLRFFSVECNAVLESLRNPQDQKLAARHKSMEISPDTLSTFWSTILEKRQHHSKPYFAFYKEGKMRSELEGIDTPKICRVIQGLCKPQNPAAEYITNSELLTFWDTNFSPNESEVPLPQYLRAVRAFLGSSATVSEKDGENLAAAIDCTNGTVTASALQTWVGDTGSLRECFLTIVKEKSPQQDAPLAADDTARLSNPSTPPADVPDAASANGDDAPGENAEHGDDKTADEAAGGSHHDSEEAPPAQSDEASAPQDSPSEVPPSEAPAASEAGEEHLEEHPEEHPEEHTEGAPSEPTEASHGEVAHEHDEEQPHDADHGAEVTSAAPESAEAQSEAPAEEAEGSHHDDNHTHTETDGEAASHHSEGGSEPPAQPDEASAPQDSPSEAPPSEAPAASDAGEEHLEQHPEDQPPISLSPPPSSVIRSTDSPGTRRAPSTHLSHESVINSDEHRDSTLKQIFTNRWVTVTEEEMNIWNIVANLPLHYPVSTAFMIDTSSSDSVARNMIPGDDDLPTLATYLASEGISAVDTSMMCLAADEKVGSESLSFGKLSLILLSCDATVGKGLVPKCETFLEELSRGTLLKNYMPIAFTALALCASEAYPEESFYYCIPQSQAGELSGLSRGDTFTLNALTPLKTAHTEDDLFSVRVVGLPKVIELATTDETEDTVVLSQWYAHLTVTEQMENSITATFVENVCDKEFQHFVQRYIERLFEDEKQLDKKEGEPEEVMEEEESEEAEFHADEEAA